ncbi:MAG TPA: patatin-like phospholipase family protein [Polyangia bacterium]|nr:patatin-like phospholipase family protein [Polyangia bacterium]
MVGLSGTARAAPHAPDDRAALAAIADHHAARGTVIRGKDAPPWDGRTVHHLAAWLGGDDAAASPDEIALLDEELSRPLALSISGAVSLGNYQGGYLYYLLAAFSELRALEPRAGARAAATKRDWKPAEGTAPLALVTGASSGSINAFVSAMTACQAPNPRPRESLFWNVWVPVGEKELIDADGVKRDGLLSTKPIDASADYLSREWKKTKWSDACRIDMGLTTTRVHARQIQPLDGVGLVLPVQTEKLTFSLTKASGEAAPTLRPLEPPPNDPSHDLLELELRRLESYDVDSVTKTLAASSAFSFAFPPRWLHLLTDDPRAPHDDGWYTDGGVFDDRPVGLAVEMRRWRLLAEGRDPKTPTRYIVQDPDVTVSRPIDPKDNERAEEPSRGTFLDTWSTFAGDFMSTSFEVALLDVLEREPGLLQELESPPRQEPVAGAYLMEFLAFAEGDFRVYDFYAGMVDAWQNLAQTSLAFQVMRATGAGPAFENAPELDCLMAYRARRFGAPGTGAPAACAAVGTGLPDGDAFRRNVEALAYASEATLAWREKQAPSLSSTITGEQETFLRALGEAPGPTTNDAPAPYVYRDLKYHHLPATAGTVDLAIRDDLQVIVHRTTTAQPLLDVPGRLVVGDLAKAALNFAYVYQPPTMTLDLAFVSDRGLSFSAAHRVPWDRMPRELHLMADVELRITGVHATQDYDPVGEGRSLAFTYGGAVHLTDELQLQRCAGNTFQSLVQLHFGGGWAIDRLSTFDGLLLQREGPELIFGAAFFQRLTFDLVASFYPFDDCANNNRCTQVASSQHDNPHALVDGNWGLRFSLGYRFRMY